MACIDDVREVLKYSDGWFEPSMESNQHILDIRLTNYQYIVVRFITGISKTEGYDVEPGKILAVNLRDRRGWIKSAKVSYFGNWRSYLIERCRLCWKIAVERAVREGLVTMNAEEYDEYQKGLAIAERETTLD